jgi:hypothetical protein
MDAGNAVGVRLVPQLFGRHYTRADLEKRIGRLDQIAGITPVELVDGRSRGVRGFDVATGSGFAFTAIADRALDVARASYEGIALSWLSRNGIVGPAYYEPRGDAFLRSFFGGLFTTCGLTSFGPPGSDRWGNFGLHGRIDATPAEGVVHETRWEGDECILEIRGIIRQTRVFGEDLRLDRCLRTTIGGDHLEVHDIVTNEGGTRIPHMILYHCNGGFPLLGDASELHLSQSSMRPRDDEAKKGIDAWNQGGKPSPEFAEQVFIHDPIACADGRAAVVLHNAKLREDRGLALVIRFDPAQLPALFTWRMLGYGTYVMGIEPANCPTIEGRVKAEERGTLPFLGPGESRRYDLEFRILTQPDEIAAYLQQIP